MQPGADDTAYSIDTTERLMAYIKSVLGEANYKYFDGDPVMLSHDYLPAVIFDNMSAAPTTGAIPTDDLREAIMIKIVLDKADDYGAAPNVDMTKKRLRRIVYGRIDSGEYHPSSIIGALRRAITLGNTVVESVPTIEFQDEVRPIEGNEDGMITAEAWITVNTKVIVPVPIRN